MFSKIVLLLAFCITEIVRADPSECYYCRTDPGMDPDPALPQDCETCTAPVLAPNFPNHPLGGFGTLGTNQTGFACTKFAITFGGEGSTYRICTYDNYDGKDACTSFKEKADDLKQYDITMTSCSSCSTDMCNL